MPVRASALVHLPPASLSSPFFHRSKTPLVLPISSSWAAVDEDAVGLLNRPRAAPVGLIAGHPRKEGSRALESSLLLIVQSTHFRINAIKYGIFFNKHFILSEYCEAKKLERLS